jgi:hypothetical protein
VSGTYTDTYSVDGVEHQHSDTAGTLSLYYEFNIGGDGIPTGLEILGRITSVNDSLDGIYAYDWVSSTWRRMGDFAGQASPANVIRNYTFFATEVGTGANLGLVRTLLLGTTLTTANLYIDQIFLNYTTVSRSAGYANGAIHVNTNKSNTNTVPGFDGTADNPVSTWAAALTLSTLTGLDKFSISNGSSIQLSSDSTNYTLNGEGRASWLLDLNDQTIDGIAVSGAVVSGTGTNGGTAPSFTNCNIGTASLPPCSLKECSLTATLTLQAAGAFYFNGCSSGVAGAGTPIIDFGAGLTASNINMRLYSGGVEVQNMGAGAGDYNMSLEGFGQLIINANCSQSSAIAIRGHFVVTDNAGGAIVPSQEACFDHNSIIDSILADTAELQTNQGNWLTATGFAVPGDEMDLVNAPNATAIAAIQSGLATSTSVLAIKAVTDALTSAAAAKLALSAGTIVVSAAAAGILSPTQMNTTLTETTDNHYNGRIIIFTSGNLTNQATDIRAYDGAAKRLTFTGLTEAPAAADAFIIV